MQLLEDDDPEALGLEVGTLPGGLYARVRLTGEPPEIYRQIEPTFKRLFERLDRDSWRPATRLKQGVAVFYSPAPPWPLA